jgi:hypothetical protein
LLMAGRPTDYRPEFAEQAEKLCKLGATDKELAEFFDVCEATINNWKNDFPQFLESVKAGKVVADVQVAGRLHERALGFEWQEAVPIKVKDVKYQDGKRVSETERVEVVMVDRVVPPDTTAGIFWLKNRRSGHWRDKQDHEHSGSVNVSLASADVDA